MSISDFIDLDGGGVGFPGTVPSGGSPPAESVFPGVPLPAPVTQVSQPRSQDPVISEDDPGCSMEVDGLFVDEDGGCTETAPPPTFATPLPKANPVPQAPRPVAKSIPVLPPSEPDFMAAMSGKLPVSTSKPAAIEVAPVSQAPAVASPEAPARVAAPSPVVVPVATVETVAAPTPATAPVAVLNQDFKDYATRSQEMQADIAKLKAVLGITVMENPQACDPQNVIHVAIWNMRHNPVGLVQMTAAQLCVYESALSAHQVYVQSLQNEWQARYTFLGREVDRLLRKCRRKYKGDREKDREEACLDAEPAMVNLRNDFLKAQAYATLLSDMGARFAQLEDGLKRTISMRYEEEKRSYGQAKWQQ